MGDVQSLFGILVSALGILGFVAAGYGVFADRRQKDKAREHETRLKGLDDDIVRRDKRIDFLEEENTRKDTTIGDLGTANTQMAQEIRSLKEYRDAQAGPLLQIIDLIRELHSLIRAHNATAESGFQQLGQHAAALEMKSSEVLGLLGNRRVSGDESIVREVRDA